jgi:hypothetical protein
VQYVGFVCALQVSHTFKGSCSSREARACRGEDTEEIPKRYNEMPRYRKGTGFVVRNRSREARELMLWRGYRRGTAKSRCLRGNVLGTVEGGTDAAARKTQ